MEVLGTAVHIRKIPAAIFIFVSLIGLYLGILAPSEVIPINDKVQHGVCFFFMGLSVYWVLDVSKRRATQLSVAILLGSSVLSEVIQSYLTIRTFDSADILANVLGSGLALTLNVLYHGRLLQRRRQAKYSSVEIDDLEEQSIPVPSGEQFTNAEESDVPDGIPDRKVMATIAE